MFSNNGLGPNCMVMLAVESTGKPFAEWVRKTHHFIIPSKLIRCTSA
jgi:hypothetical protein